MHDDCILWALKFHIHVLHYVYIYIVFFELGCHPGLLHGSKSHRLEPVLESELMQCVRNPEVRDASHLFKA